MFTALLPWTSYTKWLHPNLDYLLKRQKICIIKQNVGVLEIRKNAKLVHYSYCRSIAKILLKTQQILQELYEIIHIFRYLLTYVALHLHTSRYIKSHNMLSCFLSKKGNNQNVNNRSSDHHGQISISALLW